MATGGVRSWSRRVFGLDGWSQWFGELGVQLVVLASILIIPTAWESALLPLDLIGAVVALLLRRRFPASTFVFAGAMQGITAIVLSYSAGRRVPSVIRLVASLTATVALGIARTLLANEKLPPGLFALALVMFVVALFSVLPMVVGRAMAQRHALMIALQERAVHLEREHRNVVAQTQLRERARIAMDMHDSLGHQLTLMSLQAGGMQLASEPNSTQAEAARLLRETAHRAMEDLREIIGVLGRDGAAPTPAARRLAKVEDLASSAVAAGREVSFVQVGTRRELPAQIEHAIYRVVQEGLTNAFRHAPGSPVLVRVSYESDVVISEVIDTGARVIDSAVKVHEPGGGQGLIGLRERVRVAGGVLYAGPGDQGGFRLAAVLPYEVEQSEDPLPAELEPPLSAPVPSEFDRQAAELAHLDVATLVQTLKPRTRSLVLALSGVLGLAVVALGAAVLWLYIVLGPSMVKPETYEALWIGQPEREVLDLLGPWGQTADLVLAEQSGPKPEGTTCRHYHTADETDDDQAERMVAYRVCFAGGVLAEKKQFDAKRPY